MIAMALACEPDLLDRGRTHDSARRHDPGAGAGLAARPAAEERHGGSAHHARSRRGRGNGASRRVMYAGESSKARRADGILPRLPRIPIRASFSPRCPSVRGAANGSAVIRGSVPPLSREFIGCRFAERCDQAWDLCREQRACVACSGDQHGARCHLLASESGHAKRPESRGFWLASEAAAPDSSVHAPAPLLTVTDLRVHFPIRKGLLQRVVGHVKAVDGVSLAIRRRTHAGARGGVRLWQDDGGEGHAAAGPEPTGGRVDVRRRRPARAWR